MIIQAIRSALFYIFFFAQTSVLTILVFLSILIPPITSKVARALATVWIFLCKWGLKILVGIDAKIEGLEKVPAQGVIVASKHQSDLDILALYRHFNFPSFIAKRELFDIPLFGSVLRALRVIEIDRKAGGKGMMQMIRDAKVQLDQDRYIFIFPEGTRRAPLDEPKYKFGVIKMYLETGAPILPVALNTGLFWGRNSLILWPGTATIKILDPIPPGLSAEEVEAKLVSEIESHSTDLILQAHEKGLARPIDEDFRKRIAAVKSQSNG